MINPPHLLALVYLRLVAELTCEGFVLRVSQHMSIQVALLYETFATLVTGEVPDTRVDTFVSH